MIQRFADWLVYDIFGLSVETSLGIAVNFFFYDTVKILILLFFISVLMGIIRKSKFPQNPKRSVRFSGKRTKRSVQKRKARNTQKAETKVL